MVLNHVYFLLKKRLEKTHNFNMSFFDRFSSKKDAKETTQISTGGSLNTIGMFGTLAKTKRSDYENAFSSIRPIVNASKKIMPYFVTADGTVLDSTKIQLMQALINPNDRMGYDKFVDALMSAYLTLPEVAILVCDKQGKHSYSSLKADNIGGFIFLPNKSKRIVQGEERWIINDGINDVNVGRDKVMQLQYSALPDSVLTGVSPATASHVWAKIQDYLGDYERGFFENNATPATIVSIHAPNFSAFNKIKDEFELSYRGAGKNGGTAYNWISDNQLDGTGSPMIEIKQVGSSNNSLALKDINEVAQNKIDSNFAVPPIMRGDDSTATYANAQTSRMIFAENVIEPFVTTFWNDFQHELDRITGGLGYAIKVDVEKPESTDQKRVEAETMKVKTESFLALTNSGVSPAQAATVLDMPAEWKFIKFGEENAVSVAQVASDAKKKLDEAHECPCNHCKDAGKPNRWAKYRPPKVGEDKIKALLRRFAKRRLENYKSDALGQADQDDINDFYELLLEIAVAGGITAANQLAQQIKDQVIKREYEVSETLKNELMAEAADILNRYSEYLIAEANKVIENERNKENGELLIPAAAMTIAGLIKNNPRMELIALSENKFAYQCGRLDKAVQISIEYQVTINKTWRTTSSNPCPFCKEMEGKTVDVTSMFLEKGEVLEIDGVEYAQLFRDGDAPNAHANCQCEFTLEVASSTPLSLIEGGDE